MKKDNPITCFKGFDKEFKCRDFQFEVGKTYEHEGDVKTCQSGFHACVNPLDVWSYYGVFDSRYAIVELSGKKDKNDGDSKIAAAKIEIKAELTLPEFINKAVEWVIDYCKKKDDGDRVKASSGDYARIGSSGHSARIGSSGDYARIGSSGHSAQIGSSGYYAQIGSSGYSAQIGSSGHSAQIGSSGYYAQIGSSGYYAQIGSSGYSAQIGSSGHSARIGSSGYYARINATGEDSVIASAGYNTEFNAAEGTWVSIAEFNDNGKCIGFVTGCVGKDGIKPNTTYKAKDGKFVEVTC